MQRDSPAGTSLSRTTYSRPSFAIPWRNRLTRNALRETDPAKARRYAARLAGVSLYRVLATSSYTDTVHKNSDLLSSDQVQVIAGVASVGGVSWQLETTGRRSRSSSRLQFLRIHRALRSALLWQQAARIGLGKYQPGGAP
jgi:hypothetical protein